MDYLVRGIDYQLEDDDDPDYGKLIDEANVGSEDKDPVWTAFDAIIDDAVRGEGLLGGLEPVCEAIEDYCADIGKTDIAGLYKYIFEARGGFLTQSKAIHYLKDDWLVRFKEPLPYEWRDRLPEFVKSRLLIRKKKLQDILVQTSS